MLSIRFEFIVVHANFKYYPLQYYFFPEQIKKKSCTLWLRSESRFQILYEY